MSSAAAPAAGGRLPSWLRVGLPGGENYDRIREVSRRRRLTTVCEEARCPNLAECWGLGTATFMVLGSQCTRTCRFCSVWAAAKPSPPDPEEPAHLAQAVTEMGLEYAVVTMVCRDDLPDQGSGHAAACLRAVRAECPDLVLEFLSGDFSGDRAALTAILETGPDVFSHNLETVERLSPTVRDPRASYRLSLEVLEKARELRPASLTKSSLMLGMGESRDEVLRSLRDLRDSGVSLLTLGQYLRPSASGRQLPVREFVSPEDFAGLGARAKELGFLHVAAGPFVRSSYRAGELFLKDLIQERAHGT